MPAQRSDQFVQGLGEKIITFFLDDQNVGYSRKWSRPKKVPHEQFVQTLKSTISQLDDLELKEQLELEMDDILVRLWKQYKGSLAALGSAPAPAAAASKAPRRKKRKASTGNAQIITINLSSTQTFETTLLAARAAGGLASYKRLVGLPNLNTEQCEQLVASLRKALDEDSWPTKQAASDLVELASLTACGNGGLPVASRLSIPVLDIVLGELRDATDPADAQMAQRVFHRVGSAAALRPAVCLPPPRPCTPTPPPRRRRRRCRRR